MPHKFNAARRHKFPKKRYRVTNWAEYTEILRRRGDLTIWVTDDTLKQWRAPRRTTPGGQPKYSNIAIETCLTLRTIYKGIISLTTQALNGGSVEGVQNSVSRG